MNKDHVFYLAQRFQPAEVAENLAFQDGKSRDISVSERERIHMRAVSYAALDRAPAHLSDFPFPFQREGKNNKSQCPDHFNK